MYCSGRSGTDSPLETDKLSKDVHPHKPLRDVNQMLSILQRHVLIIIHKHQCPQLKHLRILIQAKAIGWILLKQKGEDPSSNELPNVFNRLPKEYTTINFLKIWRIR